MHVQPKRIGFAVGPGHDVRRAQERLIGDARHGASAIPVIKESLPKQGLPNAPNCQAIRLGHSGHALGRGAESLQRGIGQADAEPIDAIQR